MITKLRFVLFWVLFALPCQAANPIGIFLTWQRAPDTTMTIQWITRLKEVSEDIQYRRQGEERWQHDLASASALPQKVAYALHRVELTNLTPDTLYEFRIGKSQVYRFHTLPSKIKSEIKFIVGGDMYHGPSFLSQMEKMCRLSASTNPHFALIGGDIAYSANRKAHKSENFSRWLTWIKTWTKCMVRSDGALIPIIPAIGNHETNGRFGQTPAQAPFFYALFPMPGQQGYNVLDFGDYMSLFILDSDHTHRIPGAQTDWLSRAIAQRKDQKRKFALYHVPAWPSCETGTDPVSQAIRDNWVPQFEAFHLMTAFENHCHTYKRTHELKGVLYIGDGAWGVKYARTPKSPADTSYLAHSASLRHFVVVTLENERTIFQGIDEQGRVFDQYIKF